MAVTHRRMKKKSIDDRIERFCRSAAELLTSIHERCNKPPDENSLKKKRRGRRKKIKSNN